MNPPNSHLSNDIRPYLRKAGAGEKRSQDLTREEAHAAAACILSGAATPAQAGALLIALRVKGESPQELAGFTEAVRDRRIPGSPLQAPLIDCAAAYDGRVRTVPVGVAAALVASTAGVQCVFHGIRGLGRSGIGPGDLLHEMADGASSGIRYVDQTGYCPPLSALRDLRNEISLRTAFNTAEKLAEPAASTIGLPALLVGVFHGGYLERVAETAVLLGVRRAMVIQGLEGSDDLPVTRDSRVCEIKDGTMQRWPVELESLGVRRFPAAALEWKNRDELLAAIRRALRGEPGPVHEAIVLNTASRLYLADRVGSLAEGVTQARRMLSQGAGEQWAGIP